MKQGIRNCDSVLGRNEISADRMLFSFFVNLVMHSVDGQTPTVCSGDSQLLPHEGRGRGGGGGGEGGGRGGGGGSYAAACLRRHFLYRVVAAIVVQEGHVLLVGDGPAAGAVAHFVLAALLAEARAPHALQGDVVVAPVVQAFATAVAEQQGLIALVAQAQLAHRQLHLPQGAGLGSPGPLSPSGLVLFQAPAPTVLTVQQGPHDLPQLALGEALEQLGDCRGAQERERERETWVTHPDVPHMCVGFSNHGSGGIGTGWLGATRPIRKHFEQTKQT